VIPLQLLTCHQVREGGLQEEKRKQFSNKKIKNVTGRRWGGAIQRWTGWLAVGSSLTSSSTSSAVNE
jgi:hypothetical protein